MYVCIYIYIYVVVSICKEVAGGLKADSLTHHVNILGDKVNVSGSLYIVGLQPFESPCLLMKGSLRLQPAASLQAQSCRNNATTKVGRVDSYSVYNPHNHLHLNLIQLKAEESGRAIGGGALGVRAELTVHGTLDIKECQASTGGGAAHVRGTACKFGCAVNASLKSEPLDEQLLQTAPLDLDTVP